MRINARKTPHGLAAVMLALSLGACSTAPVQEGETLVEPRFPANLVLRDDMETLDDATDVSDPWEGFNRTIYRFNYRFDRYVFLPAVAAYQTVTPDFLEQGIHNFLENLRDITTLINSALQLDGVKTFQTGGRIFVNTTIGLLGIFDVATVVEIPKHREDFGQTLGYWGVGNGPYLVLPVFGPSNLRDTGGLLVDALTYSEIDPINTEDHPYRRWAYTILYPLDTRANVAFRYYETGTPFEYEWVRTLYATKRKLDIEK